MTMRRAVGIVMIVSGVMMTLGTLGVLAWGLANPSEPWTGDALTAYRYSQLSSGLTCSVAGILVVVFGRVVLREPDDPADATAGADPG